MTMFHALVLAALLVGITTIFYGSPRTGLMRMGRVMLRPPEE